MPHPSFDISCWNSLFILLLALVLTLFLLFLVLSNGTKLGVELELALEGADLGRHGHDLFVVGRFGSPVTLVLEIVKVGLARGHESLVDNGERPIEVAIVLLFHVGFEIVAGNNQVGIE